MAAGRYNLQILQGKLFDQTFTWKIDNVLVDLRSYSAKIEFTDGSGNQLLLLSSTLDGNGNGIILGGVDGTVEILIKTALTKTFTWDKANYELQLTRPDGEDIPFLAGRAYVTTEPASL